MNIIARLDMSDRVTTPLTGLYSSFGLESFIFDTIFDTTIYIYIYIYIISEMTLLY